MCRECKMRCARKGQAARSSPTCDCAGKDQAASCCCSHPVISCPTIAVACCLWQKLLHHLNPWTSIQPHPMPHALAFLREMQAQFSARNTQTSNLAPLWFVHRALQCKRAGPTSAALICLHDCSVKQRGSCQHQTESVRLYRVKGS